MFYSLYKTIPDISGNLSLCCILNPNNITNQIDDTFYIDTDHLIIWPNKINPNNLIKNSTNIEMSNNDYNLWNYDIGNWAKTFNSDDDVFYSDINNTYGTYRVQRHIYNGYNIKFYAPIYIDHINDIPNSFYLTLKFYSQNNKTLLKEKEIYVKINKGYIGNYMEKYIKTFQDKGVINILYNTEDNKKEFNISLNCIDLSKNGILFKSEWVLDIAKKSINDLKTLNFSKEIQNRLKLNKYLLPQFIPFSFVFNIEDFLTNLEKKYFKNTPFYIEGYYLDNNNKKCQLYDFDYNYNNLVFNESSFDDGKMFENIKLSIDEFNKENKVPYPKLKIITQEISNNLYNFVKVNNPQIFNYQQIQEIQHNLVVEKVSLYCKANTENNQLYLYFPKNSNDTTNNIIINRSGDISYFNEDYFNNYNNYFKNNNWILNLLNINNNKSKIIGNYSLLNGILWNIESLIKKYNNNIDINDYKYFTSKITFEKNLKYNYQILSDKTYLELKFLQIDLKYNQLNNVIHEYEEKNETLKLNFKAKRDEKYQIITDENDSPIYEQVIVNNSDNRSYPVLSLNFIDNEYIDINIELYILYNYQSSIINLEANKYLIDSDFLDGYTGVYIYIKDKKIYLKNRNQNNNGNIEYISCFGFNFILLINSNKSTNKVQNNIITTYYQLYNLKDIENLNQYKIQNNNTQPNNLINDETVINVELHTQLEFEGDKDENNEYQYKDNDVYVLDIYNELTTYNVLENIQDYDQSKQKIILLSSELIDDITRSNEYNLSIFDLKYDDQNNNIQIKLKSFNKIYNIINKIYESEINQFFNDKTNVIPDTVELDKIINIPNNNYTDFYKLYKKLLDDLILNSSYTFNLVLTNKEITITCLYKPDQLDKYNAVNNALPYISLNGNDSTDTIELIFNYDISKLNFSTLFNDNTSLLCPSDLLHKYPDQYYLLRKMYKCWINFPINTLIQPNNKTTYTPIFNINNTLYQNNNNVNKSNDILSYIQYNRNFVLPYLSMLDMKYSYDHFIKMFFNDNILTNISTINEQFNMYLGNIDFNFVKHSTLTSQYNTSFENTNYRYILDTDIELYDKENVYIFNNYYDIFNQSISEHDIKIIYDLYYNYLVNTHKINYQYKKTLTKNEIYKKYLDSNSIADDEILFLLKNYHISKKYILDKYSFNVYHINYILQLK